MVMQQTTDIFVVKIITLMIIRVKIRIEKNPEDYHACCLFGSKGIKNVEDKKEHTYFVKYIYFWSREHRVDMA